MSQNAAHPRHVVTAVVVAHDAARLLPGLVKAVREQTYPAQRLVGVDTGSQDRSGAVLTELLGPDAVFGMDPDTGYGAAVSSALQHPAARVPKPRSPESRSAELRSPELGAPRSPDSPAAGTEWIWLLHDDCEPALDALEQLLVVASRSRTVAVLGPKLMDLSSRRVVREAGITTDRAGRRLTGVEPGEIDQGQHDGTRAVLAVSSAGMLVRRDVWDQLGGFDANLPLFRDDIDFCWRAYAAGYEVRVVTDAVVYHRELSARQVRKTPATGGHPQLLDRRSALYVFAVNLPLWPMLAILTGCAAGSLVRAAYFVLTKQQRKAAAHLGAVAWLLRHPLLLRRERRHRAADRKHGYAVLRGQLPPGRPVGRLLESVLGVLSSGSGYNSGGSHHAMVDEPEDDLPLPAADSAARRVFTSPAVLLFAGLAVVALVAERSLTGSVLSGTATLGGGALVPAWSGAGRLWHEYLAGYHDIGIGSAASAPAYVGVMAVLATLFGGKPWLATDVLLLGGVPLAGLTAFVAARRLTPVLTARIWLAASYALLPVATGAVAAGRIGTVVAMVLLPLIASMAGRVVAGQLRPSTARAARRAAWAAGLLTGIVAAFVPLAWPVVVIAAVAAAAAWSWLSPRTVINAAIIAVVPGVILIPWTFHLLTSPSAFFGEAGLVQPGLAAADLRPASLLLLSPGGPGLPPAWVTAGLVLPALGALLLRRRAVLVRAGWGVALAGLVLGLVVSRARITPPQGGTAVPGWPGLAIVIAAAGLLLAATPLLELAGRARAGRGAGGHGHRLGTDWRFLAALAGLAAAVSAPALAAGYWLADGLNGPVAAVTTPFLPAFVAASATGPGRPRTLVIRQDGTGMTYTVLRDADPVPGEPELAETGSSVNAMEDVVASLAAAGSGDAGDTGRALSQFGIGYVLLPGPVNQTLASQLNAAAGLQPLTRANAYDLWQVSGTVARVRVLTPAGATVAVPSGSLGVNATVAPGTSGTLVLAEAAGGWSATLNGKPLTPVAAPVDGWAQGFRLPAGGGHLVIARNQTARDLSLGGEAAALLAAFVLALPGSRSSAVAPAARPDTEPATAGGPVTGGGRRQDRAERTRAGRRRQRPLVAPGDVTIGTARADGGTRTDVADRPEAAVRASASAGASARAEGDDMRVGVGPSAGAAGNPFGPHRDAAPAAPWGSSGADPGNGTAAGFPSYPEQTPPPWAGLDPDASRTPDAPRTQETPAAPAGGSAPWPDQADPLGTARPADPAPAVPRRARGGQHAARHGKPSRRSRGGDG
ncbi:MAG TPA: glycosyltransferase [Streptosporangiaceae bacterium]|nr:glycosyltransferase [Streptosporangiaceae bacterium]